ncbi:hypothetical protein KQI41_18605 [Tissierella pigra]|uniref:VirB6/TrbL-like conjugal transfer protein, CD1112 family n=1 Tax=Tissierella pigra TaxID=2607614 RepID=UPI001C117E83|nr:hypothetical protein [Tissierella pigra]
MIIITDFIMDMIESILSGVGSTGINKMDLLATPETYNSALYNGVMSIMDNAVMPIAYILLGLLFMLEIYNITIRTEGMNHFGFEIVFRTMFKIVLIKLVIDSTPLIMSAIYAISTEIIGSISSIFSGSGSLGSPDFQTIRNEIDELKILQQTLVAAQVLIIWIIYKFSIIIVQVIMIGRMFEIYIHLAIAPLPLATLPNTELSGVAKNFLKSFAAVSIQGVIIFIVLGMYNVIITNAVSVGGTELTPLLLEAMLYSLVLVASLFMTGRWSKSITNAM